MRQYLWHKRLKEMYLVVSNGKLKIGSSGWHNGIMYRKLMNDSDEQIPFARTTEEIKERFIMLETLELEHNLVSFEIMFDPKYPIERATKNSIGIDVRSTIPFVLKSGERQRIPTGVFWNVRSVDPDYSVELQVRARSGNADKRGLGMLNGVGTIDEDYRGEIHVLLINHGAVEIAMAAGDKVAQIILSVSPNPSGLETITQEKVRGTLGFGSTDSPPKTDRIRSQAELESENYAASRNQELFMVENGKRNKDMFSKALGMLKWGHTKQEVINALCGVSVLPLDEINQIVSQAQHNLLNN